MMKTIQKAIILVVASLTLAGCKGGNKVVVDSFPCIVDKDEDWGFVDKNGQIVLQDYFKNQPSAVIEGVFSVWEENNYCLYKFDPKKPELILDGLTDVGSPVGGLLPLCKKDCKIEIVDTKGKTKFELDKVNGCPVMSCGGAFNEYGLLDVAVYNADGQVMHGLVDEKGETVLAPEYNFIEMIGKNLLLVRNDEDVLEYIDLDGVQQKAFDVEQDFLKADENFVCVKTSEDIIRILDHKGELVLKCPEKVKGIAELSDKCFIFIGDEGLGVMNYDGETIIPGRYYNIMSCDKGFLAKKDNDHTYEILDSKGEKVSKVDFKIAGVISGFNIAGDGDHEWFILDGNFEPYMKSGVREICAETEAGTVNSDFFDYQAAAQDVENALYTELPSGGYVFGNAITNISEITSSDIESYGNWDVKVENHIAKGIKYDISVLVNFNKYIKKAVYGVRNKKVQRYNYWYGWYDDYEKVTVVTGWEYNPASTVKDITLKVEVPDAKVKELLRTIAPAGADKDGDVYVWTKPDLNTEYRMWSSFPGIVITVKPMPQETPAS